MLQIRKPISRKSLDKKLEEECRVLVKLTKNIFPQSQVRYPAICTPKTEGFDIGFKDYLDGDMVIAVNPSTRQIGIYDKKFREEALKLDISYFEKGYVYSLVEEYK